MTTQRKPHLSPSQLDMYCRCGEAYRRRYIEGDKIPPAIAMLKGTGVHAGAKVNMQQKIASHVDLPAKDIIDAAVAAFDAETHGGYSLLPEEAAMGAAKVIGEAQDAVATLAEVHAKHQAPDYQPVLVEELIRIELPGPRDLLGIIDLADDQKRVIDFKTGAKSKTQADVDNSVQLTTYAVAYHAKFGEPPAEVRLDTAVQTKTKAYRDVKSSTRDVADINALGNRINAVEAAIAAGIFTPAAPGSWNCSPKWCGYFNAGCPYVNSERRAKSEE